VIETSKWVKLARAIGRIFRPASKWGQKGAPCGGVSKCSRTSIRTFAITSREKRKTTSSAGCYPRTHATQPYASSATKCESIKTHGLCGLSFGLSSYSRTVVSVSVYCASIRGSRPSLSSRLHSVSVPTPPCIVWWRVSCSLRYFQPDRLVMIWENNLRFPRVFVSYPNFLDGSTQLAHSSKWPPLWSTREHRLLADRVLQATRALPLRPSPTSYCR